MPTVLRMLTNVMKPNLVERTDTVNERHFLKNTANARHTVSVNKRKSRRVKNGGKNAAAISWQPLGIVLPHHFARLQSESETGSLEHIVDEQYNIAARQLGLKTRSHCWNCRKIRKHQFIGQNVLIEETRRVVCSITLLFKQNSTSALFKRKLLTNEFERMNEILLAYLYTVCCFNHIWSTFFYPSTLQNIF